MGKWKRLHLWDFMFSKISKVHVYTDRNGNSGVPYRLQWIDSDLWDKLSLYTNGEGLYRLRKHGALLCEGDELLLAITVARLENEYKEAHPSPYPKAHARTFITDAEYLL